MTFHPSLDGPEDMTEITKVYDALTHEDMTRLSMLLSRYQRDLAQRLGLPGTEPIPILHAASTLVESDAYAREHDQSWWLKRVDREGDQDVTAGVPESPSFPTERAMTGRRSPYQPRPTPPPKWPRLIADPRRTTPYNVGKTRKDQFPSFPTRESQQND
jgi:hypothetical protein